METISVDISIRGRKATKGLPDEYPRLVNIAQVFPAGRRFVRPALRRFVAGIGFPLDYITVPDR